MKDTFPTHSPAPSARINRPSYRILGLIAAALVLCLAMDAHAISVRKRILILGDSWAASMATVNHDVVPPGFGSFDGVLAEYGFSTYVTEGATAWGGRTAQQFATRSDYRALVTQTLTNNPDIIAVHIVLGGNDFLNTTKSTNVFNAPWTSTTRDAQWTTIQGYLQSVVDLCLSIRPNIKVLISDYDYLCLTQASAAYAYSFGGMTQAQLNDAFLELGAKKQAISAATSRCYYATNWGVLQHYFDYPVAGLPLPGVYPDYIPYYGGDKTASMPPAANVGDGIHPNDAGHRDILRRCMDQFYSEWLRDVDNDTLSYSDETRDLNPGVSGVQNPFDPDVADATGNAFSNTPDGVADGNNDYDGDGLTNSAELNTYHTSPILADSDSDGLGDSWEIAHNLDPNSAVGDNGTEGDPDGDGLTNAAELAHSTDPHNADTDNDGLSDSAEINTHHTDPLVADTDGDGLNDGAEVNTYHSDPFVVDTDGDHLSDEAEANTYHTDPALADTDGDTYADGLEITLGGNPNDPSTTLPATTPWMLALAEIVLLAFGAKMVCARRTT